jgi:hypothetical protein
MHPPDDAPIEFLWRQVWVAPALGGAHYIQGKLVHLKGQSQPASRPHLPPDGYLARIERSQPPAQAIYIIHILVRGRFSIGRVHNSVLTPTKHRTPWLDRASYGQTTSRKPPLAWTLCALAHIIP